MDSEYPADHTSELSHVYAHQAVALIERLYPIPRSIVSPGNVETEQIIRNELLLSPETILIRSGTDANGWIVPRSWSVESASLVGPDGRELLDLAASNLHVMVGSMPVTADLRLPELMPHVYSAPELPDAVPYVTQYYGDDWGVCLTETIKNSLVDGLYSVDIQIHETDGEMRLLELVVPGKSKDEVFFSTYNCHPQMVNNELSGPAVWVALANHLARLSAEGQLRNTYRLYMGPETIGAIHYLAQRGDWLRRHVIAGFQLTCLSLEAQLTKMSSPSGDTYADRVIEFVLDDLNLKYERVSYLSRGSDERQWCCPAVNLPVVSVMSGAYHNYPEYHTSKDDLSKLSYEAIRRSIEIYLQAVSVLEGNMTLANRSIGEPKLDNFGLYPKINLGGVTTPSQVKPVLDLLALADGRRDLIDICRLSGSKFDAVLSMANRLVDVDLLEVVPATD